MASILRRNIVTASLQTASFGKNKKVLVSLARVSLSEALELHKMDLEFLGFPDLNPGKVEKLIFRG